MRESAVLCSIKIDLRSSALFPLIVKMKKNGNYSSSAAADQLCRSFKLDAVRSDQSIEARYTYKPIMWAQQSIFFVFPFFFLVFVNIISFSIDSLIQCRWASYMVFMFLCKNFIFISEMHSFEHIWAGRQDLRAINLCKSCVVSYIFPVCWYLLRGSQQKLVECALSGLSYVPHRFNWWMKSCMRYLSERRSRCANKSYYNWLKR